MKYFTLDDVNNVIETVEDFLADYGVRIPESDKELIKDMWEVKNGNLVDDYGATENNAIIYGNVYGDLQDRLLELFANLAKENKVANVVNSWQSEVDTWEEADE